MKHQGAFDRLLQRIPAIEGMNQEAIAKSILEGVVYMTEDVLGSSNVDAVLDRAIVGESWPLPFEEGPRWPVSPADVSLAEIAAALTKSKKEETRRLGLATLKVIASAKEDKLKEIPALPMADGGVMFTKIAIIISAQKQVEKDRHVPTGKISARAISHKVVQAFASDPWDKDHDPKKAFSNWKTDPEVLSTGRFQLLWGGKSEKPIQLELPANNSGLAATVFLSLIHI